MRTSSRRCSNPNAERRGFQNSSATASGPLRTLKGSTPCHDTLSGRKSAFQLFIRVLLGIPSYLLLLCGNSIDILGTKLGTKLGTI